MRIPAERSRGRRVVVTGAASGIGRATAERLLGDGAQVAALDLHRPDLSGGGNCRSLPCDVTDEAQLTQTLHDAATWLGGIDAVAHVAGIVGARDVPVDLLAAEDWNAVLEVNLTGAFLVAKHAVPHLERSSGVLVLTGSGAGIFNGHRSVGYAASKGGLHGLALTLEEPLRARGIRVNDVAPGAVDTPLLRAGGADEEKVRARREAGQIIDADEVAALLAFLVSAEAAAVRGTIRTW